MKPVADRPSRLGVCLVLGCLTLMTYVGVFRAGFVNMDDPPYVTANAQVQAGLSCPGIAWAFTSTAQANWHPLTWISLMIDASIGGSNPTVYHATNLALHVFNTLLLFLVLSRMTGARWRSACVAALFAVHPLHVESVAWVAERKDVLSGAFWFLTLAAYSRYVAKPSTSSYLVLASTFVLGLLAKPMLVTMPFVLLLLDDWPMGRWKRSEARRLVLEKVPLLVPAAASAVITLVVQRPAMERMQAIALGPRIANAFVTYVVYLEKLFWPKGLAIFYPYSQDPWWQPIAAAGLLVGLTVVAVIYGQGRPWLRFGWLWFLITLVPVIGLVQVGLQARADRYTYLPSVGIFVVVAWGLPALVERLAPAAATRAVLKGLAAAVVVALALVTWKQVGYWKDGVTVFTRAIEVTPENALAHFNLSDAYSARGDTEREMQHLREAVRIDPRFPDSHFNLTSALIRQRKLDEAEALCRQAQEFWPTEERTLVNLGIVELLRGNYDEAERRLSEALRLHPGSKVAEHNLAVARAGRARAAGQGN